MRLYVAASRIDEYRRVVTDCPGADEKRLIRSLTTREPMGWQALHGEALGACIAEPARWRQEDGSYLWTSREGETVSWPAHIVDPCQEAWPKGCVFEKRASSTFRTIDGDEVEVGGRADAACGLGVIEGKSRYGAVYPVDYADSLQWRFYLNAWPWAQYVEYRVHEIGGMYADKVTGDLRLARDAWTCGCETETGHPRRRFKPPVLDEDGVAGTCEDCGDYYELSRGGQRLATIHVFRMWRQGDIREELLRWVEEFTAWAKDRELTDYLKPWGERKGAA